MLYVVLFPYVYDLCCVCLNISFFVIHEDVVTIVTVYSCSLQVWRSNFLLQCLVFFYSSAYASSFTIATAFLHALFETLCTSLSSSSLDCCHFLKASFLTVVASCICYVHHQVFFSTYHPPGHDSPIYDLAISQIQLSTSLYSISYQESSYILAKNGNLYSSLFKFHHLVFIYLFLGTVFRDICISITITKRRCCVAILSPGITLPSRT